MELLKNLTYKQNLKFVKNDEDDKRLNLNISIGCNHDIDKELIIKIEKTINDLFINNYVKVEDFKKKEKDDNEKIKDEIELKRKNAIELQKQMKIAINNDSIMNRKKRIIQNIF
jgi:hypothetical protein